MRILVAGGAGYIGSNMTAILLAEERVFAKDHVVACFCIPGVLVLVEVLLYLSSEFFEKFGMRVEPLTVGLKEIDVDVLNGVDQTSLSSKRTQSVSKE